MSYPSQIRSLEEYQSAYKKSVDDPEGFWAGIAEQFTWHRKWDKVLDWNFSEPKVKWFSGAKLNITENCLDRHLAEKSDQPAIIWEPNDPEEAYRVLTYKELHFKVCQFATVLKNNGVKKADRICIYMPMVPELAIAVLACARIGAIHSVVFGGFSAQSISDRIQDAQCNLVITADGAFRGNKEIPDLKRQHPVRLPVNYTFPAFISSTTAGSSRVVVSPRFWVSPSAIFRRMRRMIFPLRVFGRPLTN